MLEIVDVINSTSMSATVRVRGSAHDEVSSADARRLAIDHATALGLRSPGISASVFPYPVDSEGEQITPERASTTRASNFQADIKVTGMP